MASVTAATVQTALETFMLPACNNTYSGLCVDNWPSGKGSVVYYDFASCSSSFINLPGINLLPDWLLGCMWALFLVWLFFGIAIVSDAFVASIEVITAQTHIVVRVDKAGNRVEREEEVWNWVVANITLLAVGSSSPEILLSLIDTLLTLDKPAGQIGASTIVGSAAYNLFVISAVCMVCLPAGTFRKIEHLKVFIWTTSWSLWAYFWLWIVYKKVSPNVIEIWEAWLTLAFMPLFVWTTYMVDTRGWNWFAPHKNSVVVPVDDEGRPDEESGGAAGDKGPAQVGQGGSVNKHTILYYRAMAMQNMGGNIHATRIDANGEGAQTQDGTTPLLGKANRRASMQPGGLRQIDLDGLDRKVPAVFMKSPEVAVLESKGEARLTVVRMHGDLKATVTVRYATKDDTAVAGLDYEPVDGELVFGPGEEAKDIVVRIIDDDMSEPDVMFTVELLGAAAAGGGDGAVNLLQATTSVTIVDDDDSGLVMFELPTFEAGMQDSTANVVVVRRHGADGAVSIDYATKDGSAEAGKHFAAARGRLEFAPGEVRKLVSVPLLPVPAIDPSSKDIISPAFRLVLSNPMGGVTVGTRKECRVVLVPGALLADAEAGDKKDAGGDGGFDLWGEWAEQFKTAMTLEFEEDDDNLFAAVSLHYVSITYKLMAACCPPAVWGHGYPLFTASLLLLAGLMAIVKEVGEMFGCACGLSDVMTGLSIVALGTSLPDTFASRMAALSSDTADAAIGNIMGSNCCNVFLGLGIPWAIAASYYEVKNEPFFSQSGSLGFSLMIYFILAVVAIAVLMWRRYGAGGELGAVTRNEQWLYGALFGGLWLLFLLLSGLNDYGHIPDAGM